MHNVKSVIRVDNRTFTVEHDGESLSGVSPQVLFTVQVPDQPPIMTMLNEEQLAALVDALNKRCRRRWRAGVVVRPDGSSIPDGARCLRIDKHERCRFRTRSGEVVEK